MFTSRAEYRLTLREDNADQRLTAHGRELGCIDDERWGIYCRKRDAVAREAERLKSTWVNPRLIAPAEATRILGAPLEREHTLSNLLKRPGVSYAALCSLLTVDGDNIGAAQPPVAPDVAEQVEISVKYDGYIARQDSEVARQLSHETTRLPESFDYDAVRGLSIEVRQKLKAHRPETIGQAARISGVTPAAISLLLVHLKRLNRGQKVDKESAERPRQKRVA